MLKLMDGIKRIFRPIPLFFALGLLCNTNLYAIQLTTKPIVWYNVWGRDIQGPDISSLMGVLSEQQAESFDKCRAQANGYTCANFSYSNSKTTDTGSGTLNGLPNFYYNVGDSWGTGYQKISATAEETSWPTHNLGVTVKVNQTCRWPYSAKYSDDSKSMTCVATDPETNSCDNGVGNPISPATGNKYEHEIDYASADGLLTVERTYINQNTGWVVDRPIQLSVLSALSETDFPEYFGRKFVFTFTKSIVNNSVENYEYVYQPQPLVNSSNEDTVYLWQGRKSARFTERDNNFSSNDFLGKNNNLEKINAGNSAPEKWLLKTVSNDKHYFAADGTLLRTEFATGGFITYIISGGKIQSKTDQFQRSINYSYDADGRLISVTPPDGNVITYSYGNSKQARDFRFLKKVTWANGESVSYLYNEAANMLDGISIETGPISLTGKLDSVSQRVGNYQYLANQAVFTEGFNGINRKQLTYNGMSTTVTDALNSSRTYQYIFPADEKKLLSGSSQPAGSGCNASTKNIIYYPTTDLKRSETNFNGHTTQYAYDMTRQLETVRVEGIPFNNNSDYLPSGSMLDAGIRKVTTQWHSQWNKPVKTAEPQLITTLIYNGDSDPFNGNAIAQCAPLSVPLLCHKIQQATTDSNGASGLAATLDSSTSKREWLYTYNDRGQLLTSARTLNGTAEETREYYEVTSNLASKGDLKKITNALGQHTDFTQYDANGRVLRMLDMNGVESQYGYDQRGRLTSQSVASATPSTHTYDLNGNRIKSVLPNGVALNYMYDPMHRLLSIETALGDKINYEYDLESNLRYERVTNASGAIGYIKEHIYDALSREKNTVNSFGQSQTHLYDANGNAIGKIDAKQQATTQSFDALNQLKLSSDALNGKTDYSYDGQGRITQVKDAKGNITSYTYNAFGDLLSQTSPDTGITTFSYDALGNRIGAVDARTVQVQYNYDALNRLTSVKYPAASIENVTYSYDDSSSGNFGIGRLTGVINTGAGLAYSYNAQGLISQKIATVNAVESTTQYLYDLAGNLRSIVYPSGRIVNYTYDNAGRVQSVKTKETLLAAEQTVVTGINYLPFGPANSYTFGNGLSHSASYDNDYRLTGIQVGGIFDRAYTYDPVDNITGISNLVASSKNQNFTYDAVNRLITANGIYGALAYTYDAVGNRTSEKTDSGTTHLNDTYIYSPTSNRLTSISKTSGGLPSGARSFSYDAAGNRIQGTAEDGKVQDYTYNKANRLETAKVTGALVGTYAYNALGQRVSKTLPGGSKEIYHYDEAGQLIAVTDAAGNSVREYIYMGNQLVSFVNIE